MYVELRVGDSGVVRYRVDPEKHIECVQIYLQRPYKDLPKRPYKIINKNLSKNLLNNLKPYQRIYMIDVQVMTPKNLANVSNVGPDWSEQMLGLANVVGDAMVGYNANKKQEELEQILRDYESYQQDPKNNAFAVSREKLNAKLLELQGSPFDSIGSQDPTVVPTVDNGGVK